MRLMTLALFFFSLSSLQSSTLFSAKAPNKSENPQKKTTRRLYKQQLTLALKKVNDRQALDALQHRATPSASQKKHSLLNEALTCYENNPIKGEGLRVYIDKKRNTFYPMRFLEKEAPWLALVEKEKIQKLAVYAYYDSRGRINELRLSGTVVQRDDHFFIETNYPFEQKSFPINPASLLKLPYKNRRSERLGQKVSFRLSKLEERPLEATHITLLGKSFGEPPTRNGLHLGLPKPVRMTSGRTAYMIYHPFSGKSLALKREEDTQSTLGFKWVSFQVNRANRKTQTTSFGLLF